MTERHIITLLGYPIGTVSDEDIDQDRVIAVLEEVAERGIHWLGDWKAQHPEPMEDSGAG